LYTKEGKEYADALKEYLTRQRQSKDENNHFLIGKLLGYSESDIKYFYEDNKLTTFEADEKEAAKWLNEKPKIEDLVLLADFFYNAIKGLDLNEQSYLEKYNKLLLEIEKKSLNEQYKDDIEKINKGDVVLALLRYRGIYKELQEPI